MFDWYIDAADSPLLWGLHPAFRFHAAVLEFLDELAALNFASLYRYWEMGGEQWIATVAFNNGAAVHAKGLGDRTLNDAVQIKPPEAAASSRRSNPNASGPGPHERAEYADEDNLPA